MIAKTLEASGTLWTVGGLIVVLFLATNLPWHLDDYDQAKQAYASFEMVNAGHWFYQHTPHERIATKPPLVAWISAGLFAITRSWELAWRLPSLLAAMALSILLFRAARAAYGPAAGFIALFVGAGPEMRSVADGRRAVVAGCDDADPHALPVLLIARGYI